MVSVDCLGLAAWIIFASLGFGALVGHNWLIAAVCIAFFVGSTIAGRVSTNAEQALWGIAVLAITMCGLVFIPDMPGVVLLLTAIPLFSRLALQMCRAVDRERLLAALARDRGSMLGEGSGALIKRLGIELTTPEMRANLTKETQQLGKSTRQSFVIFGRALYATTDADADRFGADALEAYFRDLVSSTLPGDLGRAALVFVGVSVIHATMWLYF